MRELTRTQKNLIKRWYSKNKEIRTVDDLSLDQMEKLENLNDFETIWHHANRLLWDLRFDNN
jgi:hypothetical protein